MHYIAVISNETKRRVVFLEAKDKYDLLKKCYAQYGMVVTDVIVQVDDFPSTPEEVFSFILSEQERAIRSNMDGYVLYRQPTIRVHAKEIIHGAFKDVDHEQILAILGEAATGERVDYKEPTHDWMYSLKPWITQKEQSLLVQQLRDAGYDVHE